MRTFSETRSNAGAVGLTVSLVARRHGVAVNQLWRRLVAQGGLTAAGKCRYCEYWRLKHYSDELTIAEWQAALTSVKEFVGTFSINFSGGEPFIKPGFIDLLAWCNSNGISAGVTTNGSALTLHNAVKVVAANPFNINVSVDAPNAEIHDYLRGYPGLFDKLSKGIR